MVKRPRIWTDLDESVRLVPLCGTFEKKFGREAPEEKFFDPGGLNLGGGGGGGY